MNTFCYVITFIFEQFISYQYFNNKFEKKVKLGFVILSYAISFIFQYSINYFGIPYLNLITFCISNIVVGIVCFKVNLKQIILNTFFLEAIMIATEVIAMYLFATLLEINFSECKNNNLILFLETITTKILYFIVTFMISKFSTKESKKINDYSIFLFVPPATSIFTIVSFTYLSFNFYIDKTTNILFTLISTILLVSNILIFIIHEKTVDTLMKNAELQLEKQKELINKEYYRELEKQYKSSSILIHDIKNVLSNIKVLSMSESNESVSKYVNSIYQGYQINSLKQYSTNRLINVIANRYANLCKEESIKLDIDIRDIDFSFITDSDLTALLDNLLENAYEASKASSKKEIDFVIDRHNEKYIIIKVSNFTETVPKINGNIIVTSKENKIIHGIGTKSIARIVQRYDGNIEYSFFKEKHIFRSIVLLKMN